MSCTFAKPRYLVFADGESQHVVKWVRSLVEVFDLYVVSLGGISNEIVDLIGRDKCFSLNNRIKRSGDNFRYFLSIPKVVCLVGAIRPHFIHSQYITSYGLISALVLPFLGRRPYSILSAWGSDILVAPSKSVIHKSITIFALRRSDVITSDSSYMSKRIKSFTRGRVPICTFPLGLEEFPEGLSVEDKDKHLYYSNRALEPNYRIDLVLRLFAVVAASDSAAMLVVTNVGSCYEKLKELAVDLGVEKKVIFMGFVSGKEKYDLYTRSQFYFSMPASDATSVSLLEAMAYGCVPIVSDIPANREWVENGINGIVIKSENCFSLMQVDVSEVFRENRRIIKKKAIWCNAFVEYLYFVRKYSGVSFDI